ncbi:caspase family protein [Streptomyces bambusae]|uniref:Caspase family protein n=1 Tax=Streptomyces bambusae TaxID=1550616 RepID=A0ABS6Z9B8_9ACTN|nr:caspase family protein [Streptomyces bambusae]MBW5483321.1 caspase family protein [Streptomyces bambusae]
MGKIYALLVGINEYPDTPWANLKGCRNDVAAARAVLEQRSGGRIEVRELHDDEATTEAVADAVRTHLGQAGSGDTALLWYAGHGTEYAAATPLELITEPTGRSQALCCTDGPLPDKRLGALLDGAAARGGHVVAVLDCCFSGGATREEAAQQAGHRESRARFLPPGPNAPAPSDAPSGSAHPGVRLRPEADAGACRDAAGPAPRPRHLLLAASRIDQRSTERLLPGPDGRSVHHGVFSHSLVTALRAAPPGVTARQLFAEAQAAVRRTQDGQHPSLWPQEPGGLADRPLLGGAAADPSPYLLREGPEGWEVDCGRAHGLSGDAGTEFSAAAGPVRVRAVLADRSLVDPAGWIPEPGSVHPVALSALALPPAAVVISAPPARAAAAALLAGRLDSPLLRTAEHGSAEADRAPLLLRLDLGSGQHAAVLRRDGIPYVDPLPLADPLPGRPDTLAETEADAARIAVCLAQLAQWHRIRDLSAGTSPLRGHVRVEIRPWDRPDGPPLAPDANGEIVLRYRQGAEPWVGVRLHNSGPRPLWCALISLNDRFGASTALFPGDFIGPGGSGHVWDGDPVRMVLPPSRPVRPGAFVRDWLTLLVAEGEMNTLPFHLTPWDPQQALRSAPPADALIRLTGGPGAGNRDALRVRPGTPIRWATTTLPVRTVVL